MTLHHIIKAFNMMIRFLIRVPFIIICKIRSIYYSTKIDSGGGKIIITDPFISFKIKKDKSSELSIKGKFRIIPHVGGRNPIVILMASNSKFQVDGDFVIGQGVRFSLSPNSTLIIGGKEKESDSGITSDTLIMVKKRVEIGKDFICAWGVFITDCDWHYIEGEKTQADVKIGDHVWIANNNNILKGTTIGNNCIVASNSKINNKFFPDNVLIGGIPSKILKENINWRRSL